MLGQKNSLEQAFDYLQKLDLTYLVDQMCAQDYCLPRWLKEHAEHCAQRYKNFLSLHIKYANIPLVPTKEIDEFWHNHILHTKKYLYDCEQLFGGYLHHTPLAPADDLNELIHDFQRTKQLYFAEFGTEIDSSL